MQQLLIKVLQTKGQAESQKAENNFVYVCSCVCCKREGEKLQTQSIAENVNVSARMRAQQQGGELQKDD